MVLRSDRRQLALTVVDTRSNNGIGGAAVISS
jgi:hypothetical protein